MFWTMPAHVQVEQTRMNWQDYGLILGLTFSLVAVRERYADLSMLAESKSCLTFNPRNWITCNTLWSTVSRCFVISSNGLFSAQIIHMTNFQGRMLDYHWQEKRANTVHLIEQEPGVEFRLRSFVHLISRYCVIHPASPCWCFLRNAGVSEDSVAKRTPKPRGRKSRTVPQFFRH
jgi:hypothetical protein